MYCNEISYASVVLLRYYCYDGDFAWLESRAELGYLV